MQTQVKTLIIALAMLHPLILAKLFSTAIYPTCTFSTEVHPRSKMRKKKNNIKVI